MSFISNFQSGSNWTVNSFNEQTGMGLNDIQPSKLISAGSNLVSSFTGVSQIAQIGAAADNSTLWNVANPKLVQEVSKFIKYNDFRSEKELPFRRIDGTSALTRGSILAGVYAAASVTPGGVYNVFNLNGAGKTGRGWGDHDNPNILRNDFTAMSHVNTKWRGKANGWKGTNNPAELITPFTGDKVQVIDFGKRKLDQAYRWKPKRAEEKFFGSVIDGADKTQDFIKFFLTGPKLQNNKPEEEDDIIVFRAIIESLDDSFTAGYSPVQMIGRADPNYHYSTFGRSSTLSFKVAATTRDEVKPIWRKLNALAGYTAPEYLSDSIAPVAPWMRITIGDLFHQQPILINSLTYTLHSSDTIWETNIEKDPEMMEVPHMIDITLSYTMINDTLPQKGGKFYSLANENVGKNDYGEYVRHKHNWLSDFDSNKGVFLVAQTTSDADINTGDIIPGSGITRFYRTLGNTIDTTNEEQQQLQEQLNSSTQTSL